jgi:hypothetical protein
MAAATTIIAATALAVAAAGTAHSIESSNQAKREGNRQKKIANEDMARMEGEAKAREADEASTEKAMIERNQARSRQRALANNAQGRAGTILTGPLGASGDAAAPAANTANKSLLGM